MAPAQQLTDILLALFTTIVSGFLSNFTSIILNSIVAPMVQAFATAAGLGSVAV